MILIAPDMSPAALDTFSAALDAAKGDRSVATTGTRFDIIEDPPLSDAERAAILAVADAFGATIEGTSPPKALAHGAKDSTRASLLAWSPDAAYPRLQRIDAIGAKGFLRREAWYRPADCDYGLSTTPKAGAVAVYAIDYPSWTYGVLPGSASTKGITSRGPRTQTWTAEDGTVALTLTDAEPKTYSYIEALSAGARRRSNVVGTSDNLAASRVAGVVVQALLTTYPGEDPGARVGELLGALDGPIRLYRGAGEGLRDALLDPGLLATFPWLGALLGGVPAVTYLVSEVEEPADGDIIP